MDYSSNENRFNSRSYGGGEREGNGNGGGGGYRSNFSASERSVIQIPGTHIGKIIGPAGRHINDMQRQYNVRIQINKMVSTSFERSFGHEVYRGDATFQANSDGTKDAEISGNNINDIQDAIKAINEQIDAPFERRGGGGGGRGGYGDGGFGKLKLQVEVHLKLIIVISSQAGAMAVSEMVGMVGTDREVRDSLISSSSFTSFTECCYLSLQVTETSEVVTLAETTTKYPEI